MKSPGWDPPFAVKSSYILSSLIILCHTNKAPQALAVKSRQTRSENRTSFTHRDQNQRSRHVDSRWKELVRELLRREKKVTEALWAVGWISENLTKQIHDRQCFCLRKQTIADFNLRRNNAICEDKWKREKWNSRKKEKIHGLLLYEMRLHHDFIISVCQTFCVTLDFNEHFKTKFLMFNTHNV